MTPELVRTERLVLRRVVEDDWPAMVEIHEDPTAGEHGGDGALSSERIRELFTAWKVHWEEHGFGYWTIIEAGTGQVMGFGGLRHAEHDGYHSLNMYYRLGPAARGQGYAVEMGRAAVEWADAHLPHLPVTIGTKEVNGPSIRVAERLGFRLVRAITFRDGSNAVLYEHP